MQTLPESVRWYGTLLLITWALAPWVRALAAPLPDRGAFLAKPLGMLAAVWPLWFIASATPVPFGPLLLWATVVIGGVVGWAWLLRRDAIDQAWIRSLLVAEAVTLVTFVAYLGFRGYTPQITGTEKPMDIALMSASARAVDMPPADPWMAGATINYYYLGYLLHGSISRMSDVATSVGYNLALATTFAMAIAAAAGLGFGIARRKLGTGTAVGAGVFSAFFVVIAGNLRAPLELLQDPGGTWNAWWWQGPGWEASRVVIDSGARYEETINEFPSFSFVLGDLHPHVMALPFTIVSLALAVALSMRTVDVSGPWHRRLWPSAATGAVIGALYPLNSWDYPTFLVAAIVALLLSIGWRRETLLQSAVLAAASIVAWAPFWVTFVPFAGDESSVPEGLAGIPVLPRLLTTVAAYRGERTSASEFFTIFGVAWLIAVIGLAVEVARATNGSRLSIGKPAWAALVGVAFVAIAIPAPVLVLAGVPFSLAIWLVQHRDERDPGRTVVATLFAAGFALIVITEFFYIQDVFDGRLNTLFKVYYQVWTLVGIAAGVTVARLWAHLDARPAMRPALGAAATLALVAGLAYPLVSAQAWTEAGGPREWKGLDGAAFIDDLEPDDLAAILWLRENGQEGDVILEAPGCSYTINTGVPTGRLAAYTGIPTVIGWAGHERQWRGGQPDLLAEVGPRADDVRMMYAAPTDASLMDRYGITLMYVGGFERDGTGGACEIAGPFPDVLTAGYPGDGWTEVFASGDARIYRREA